jgi:hypothetical protein
MLRGGKDADASVLGKHTAIFVGRSSVPTVHTGNTKQRKEGSLVAALQRAGKERCSTEGKDGEIWPSYAPGPPYLNVVPEGWAGLGLMRLKGRAGQGW